MEPDELARELREQLEQWSLDFSKVTDSNLDKRYPPSRWPLWNMKERNLVYCVAEILEKKGWKTFFEINYGGEGGVCDLFATKSREKNLWIECKLLHDNDGRLTPKRWKEHNEFKKDLRRLKKIEGARSYFVLFVTFEINPPKRRQRRYSKIVKAMKQIKFDFKTEGFEVKDKGHQRKETDETDANKIYVREVN